MTYSYDRRTAAVTSKGLARVLTKAFTDLKLPYIQTEYETPEDAAEAFGEQVDDEISRAVPRLLDRWADAIEEAKFQGKPTFAAKGSEHLWDEYAVDDFENTHVYYECYFPSPIAHRAKFQMTPVALFRELDWPRDFSAVQFGDLLAHPPVAEAVDALLRDAVKRANFGDRQFGALADAAVEYAYDSLRTDFKASNDTDDDLYVCPIDVRIGLTVKGGKMTAEVTGREVMFTTVFTLDGEILWPGNTRYDRYV